MFLDSQDSQWRLISGRGHRRRGTFSLRLTPMIDMFTILLVFLLKSFSAEGQIMTIAPDLRLPESTAKMSPKTTSVVAVTQEWVLLDGRPVARVEDVLSSSTIIVPNLLKELQDLRALTEGISQLAPGMAFKGNITIQGDKGIAFELLKRVMVTCGRMGYNDMFLAVMELE
jgi:biopolymer transport protein TolR